MTPLAARPPHHAAQRRAGSFARADDSDESPLHRVRRLRFSPTFASYTASTQKHMARCSDVTKLTAPIAKILDEDCAPFFVCRWIAWGHWLQDRAIRLAILMLMREEEKVDSLGRSRLGWSWPKDCLFVTAERTFWASPQARRLVKSGILVEQGSVPVQGRGALFTMAWDQSWAAVQREFATFNRTAFIDQVEKVAAQRTKRCSRKRRKLTAEDRAYLEALKTLQRGYLRGRITLDEAGALLTKEVRSKS